MRALFVVSGGNWDAHARAFVLAARGLRGRGHDVLLACASDCPVQVRASMADIPIASLKPSAAASDSTMQMRRVLKDAEFDVVFVHTDGELLRASSAIRLGRVGPRVIRRVPPFVMEPESRGARFASKLAPTGVLYSTEADLAANGGGKHRLPAAVAPLAIDIAEHDATSPTRATIGADPNATVIVCVHDGVEPRQAFIPMRTLALLASRHPELHLVMVGARQDDLRMEGAALGINARVTYLGARDDELSILRIADVGWIAAQSDAAAFAALDFMAFRAPVIAERTPLSEHYVVDGIGGLIIPRAESPAETVRVAALTAAFLARKDARVAMGKAGRSRLEREFSFDEMLEGYERAGGMARATASVT